MKNIVNSIFSTKKSKNYEKYHLTHSKNENRHDRQGKRQWQRRLLGRATDGDLSPERISLLDITPLRRSLQAWEGRFTSWRNHYRWFNFVIGNGLN